MPRFTRAELEAGARAIYNAARDAPRSTGDWNIWAGMFTEDAHYIEHAYGEMHGRRGDPRLDHRGDGAVPAHDLPAGLGVLRRGPRRDRVPVPERLSRALRREHGKPYAFPNWTRLVYAGNGQFSSEEDIYNPARDRAARASRLASPPAASS